MARQTQSGTFKQTLSVGAMVVYGLVFMMPVAPFAIYGNVFQASGGMPALPYVIGLVGMVFTVFSFGVMIRRFPSSGSIYTYVTKTMSTGMGFVTGWLMLLQYLITPNLVYLMAAQALNQYVPEVPVVVWCLAFNAFVTVVSLRSVETGIAVDRIALIGQLIVLGLFMGFAIHYVATNPDTASFAPTAFYSAQSFNLSDVMSAVSLCVMSYIGFGCIATLTQQAKDMRQGPPRAMLITLLVLGAMFIGTCYLACCVDPTGACFAKDANNGFYLVAEKCGGEWLGVVCAVTNALAYGLFSGLVGQVSVSHILYAMGTSGALPKRLGHLSEKGVPRLATLFVSLFSLVTVLPFFWLGVDQVAKCSNFGALASYLLLNASVVWFCFIQPRRAHKPEGHIGRYLVCPLIGIVVVGWIFASLSAVALVVGFVWIAIGIAYYLVQTRVRHKVISLP